MFAESYFPRLFPGSGLASRILRVLTDRLVFSPAFLLLTLYLLDRLKVGDVGDSLPINRKAKRDSWSLQLKISSKSSAIRRDPVMTMPKMWLSPATGTPCWPTGRSGQSHRSELSCKRNFTLFVNLRQIVNINLVAPQYRVLFANLVALVWNSYLASIKKK